MLERLSVSSKESASRTFSDGTTVVARRIEPRKIITGKTSKHEAVHTDAVRGEIVEADIIAKDDALGTTRPVRLTPVAAAAAGAMGYGGTGWDRFITENYFGVSWESAMNQARAILSGREEYIEEIAQTLEKEKRIGPFDVKEAYKRVDERKEGIYPVKVDIYRSGIRVQAVETTSFHNEIKIPVPPFSIKAKRL